MDGPLQRTRLSVAIAMVLASRFSAAADFTVDSTSDTVAEDGVVTLREAIMASSTNMVVNADLPAGDADGDSIGFDPGVFDGTQPIVLAAMGQLAITDDLVIDGPGGGSIVEIDGNAITRIFVVETSEFVRITGVSLVNGNAGSAPDDNGGALKLEGDCDVTLTKISISGNSASNGGAIEADCAQLSITGSTISGNTAGINGGGIHTTGATVSISNTTISGNTAAQEGGGLWNSGTVTITNSTISGNSAAMQNAANDAQGGGGIFNNGGTISLQNTLVADNVAGGTPGDADDGGGGIFNDGRNAPGAQVMLDGMTILSNNMAAGNGLNGGGILNIGASGNDTALTATPGVKIIGNLASRAGGGIESNNAVLNLTGAEVSGNSAGVNGGGVHVTGAGFSMLGEAMVSGNTAGQEGGGLWNSASANLTITNTTISGNTASAANADNDAQGGGGVFNNGGTISISNSTITNNHVNGDLGNGDDGGGGIFNDGRNTSGARVELFGITTLSDNIATGSGFAGGGILNIGLAGNGTEISAEPGVNVMNNQATRAGGGIENNSGVLTLAGVGISGNSAGVNGGGLHVSGAGLSNLTGATVSGNTAVQEGGGLWNSASATLTITNSTISGNTANAANAGNDAQGGGGVFNNGGTVSLLGSAISNNRVFGVLDPGDGGGGIFMDARNAMGGLVRLSDTDVTGNQVSDPGGRGGGLMVVSSEFSAATVEILGGLVGNNVAPQAGGGVESDSSVVVITGTTISGNSAGVNGGGIHTQSRDVMTITDSTVSGNTAGQEGGGLWNSATSNMTISGTTISGNTATAQNSADQQGGGGIFNNGGTVVLRNSLVANNLVTGDLDASDGGGGIFNDGRNTSGAQVVMSDTDIFNNQVVNTARGVALAGRGGAAQVIADNSNFATISITGGLISGNTAPQGGGAFSVRTFNSDALGGASSTLSLHDTTIQGNSTQHNGGAVNVQTAGGAAFALIQDSLLISNMAGNEGGALWAGPETRVDLDFTQVDSNSASIGGGLFMDSTTGIGAEVSIQHSAIVRNAASFESGGGIDSEAGTISIFNSTVSNNSAVANGGGLNFDASAVFEMNFVTVAENQAGEAGGGMFAATEDGSLNSGLFGHNQAALGPDISGAIMASHSLISDTSALVILGGIANQLDVDPRIETLGDNGGPTLTHALLGDSTAIDAGDENNCPEFDQRGFSRPGDFCDIGAFDFDGFLDRFYLNGFER